MSEWVAWTLLAASMQAVRTAGQKYLHESLSALTATLARYLSACLWCSCTSFG